jgi:hypothetical protein
MTGDTSEDGNVVLSVAESVCDLLTELLIAPAVW